MPTLRCRAILIAFVASVPLNAKASLADLIFGGNVDDVKEAVTAEAESYRKTLDADVQTLLRAIPGQQWAEATYWVNQDCSKHPEDPRGCEIKREQYANFLLNSSRLGAPAPAPEDYELTVSLDSKKVDWSKIHINAYQAYFADVTGEQAKNFVAQEMRHHPFNDAVEHREGGFVSRPITRDETNAAAITSLQRAYQGLVGLPTIEFDKNRTFDRRATTAGLILDEQCNNPGAALKVGGDLPTCRRQIMLIAEKNFTDNMLGAITAPYQEVTETRTVGERVFPWRLGVVAEHAVVLLPEKELNEIYGADPAASIKIWIHKKGDSHAMPEYASQLPIELEDFDRSLDFDEEVGKHRKFVYTIKAVVPPGVTDNRAIVENVIAQREAALRLTNVIRQPKGARPAPPWWRTFLSNAFVVAVFLNALVIVGAIVVIMVKLLRKMRLGPAAPAS
jgi:hypothetical protein